MWVRVPPLAQESPAAFGGFFSMTAARILFQPEGVNHWSIHRTVLFNPPTMADVTIAALPFRLVHYGGKNHRIDVYEENVGLVANLSADGGQSEKSRYDIEAAGEGVYRVIHLSALAGRRL